MISPPPPLSRCPNLRKIRETGKNWKCGGDSWGMDKARRLDGGRSRVKDKETAAYLVTIWGRTILVICRRSGEDPVFPFPLLSPAETPAPSSSSLLSPYLPSGNIPLALPLCQAQFWGMVGTTQSDQSSLTLDPVPPSPDSPGPQTSCCSL